MATLLRAFLLALIASSAFANSDSLHIPLHTKNLNLDPSGIQDSWSLWVSRQLNCQLIRTSGRDVVFDAAETVKFIQPTLLEFQLRDLHFSDGSPVRSSDVIATLQWLKKNRKVFRNLFDWISNLQSKGERTFQVRLKHPVPNFLRSFAAPNYGIYPSEFLTRAANDPALWKNPVGCGKYRVSPTVSPVGGLNLDPVGKGHPIVFELKEGESLKADTARYDIIPPPFSDGLQAQSAFTTVDSFDPKQLLISVNTTLPRWQSREARCSLLRSANLGPVLSMYGPQAERSTQLFPRGVLGFDPSLNTSDVQKAGPVSQQPTGCISFLGLSVPTNRRTAFVDAFRPAFHELRTEVFETPSSIGPQFLKSGCDLFVIGFKSNYLDGYEFILPFSEPSIEITGYHGRKISERVKASQEISDPQARARAYQEVQSIALEECLVLPVLTIPQRSFLMKKDRQMPGIGTAPLIEYDLSEVI